MDIDRCNSIFELFVAFNYAHAALSDYPTDENSAPTNSYIDLVDRRFLRTFIDFVKRGNNLLDEIAVKIQSSKTQVQDGDKRFSDVQLQYESLNLSCNTWLNKVKAQKNKEVKRINSIFPYLSFFLGTYCVSVLVLSISESHVKHFSLLLLVLFSMFMYVFIRYKKGGTTYTKLAYTILAFSLIVGINHFVFSNFYHHFSDSVMAIICVFEEVLWLKITLVITAVLIPFFHFVYYFLTISITNKGIEREWYRTIETSEEQFAAINTTYERLEASKSIA